MAEYLRFVREEFPHLAYGVSLTFLSNFGQTFFVSLFVPYLLVEFSLSNAEFGTLYASATLGSALLLPWTGHWMDRVRLSRFTLVIAAILGASALLIAGSSHILPLFLGILGLRLAGPGLAAYTALTAMARHYSAGLRGKALGASSLGFSIGEAALPLLGTSAIALLGWRRSWALVAAVVLLLFAPLLRGLIARSESAVAERGALGGYRAPPAEFDVEPESAAPALAGWDPATTLIPEPAGRASQPARQWSRGEMLADSRFWFMLPAALLPPFWATGIFLYQASIGAQKGWSLTVMASAFTAYAVARVAFSLVGGGLVDRFTARRVFPFSLLPLGVGLALLIPFAGAWVPYAFMACVGITTGMSGNVRVALWTEMYGVRHLGSIKALMAALVALSTAGSPILVGLVLDAGTGLESLLWSGVLSIGVGAALTLGALGGRQSEPSG